MINLEPLINKNVQKSQLISQIMRTTKDEIYPTITVARDPGSGGKAVAEAVAKQLGIKLFDDELIDLVAKQAKSKPKLVKALDEKTQSAIESLVNSFLGNDSLPEQTFIKSFATVVLSIAAHQPAVIVGRGMSFVLPTSTSFRVRVTAPRKTLVKYAMKYEGHSAKKARQVIDKYMQLRHDFVYKYFGKNMHKAHYYDLVINTEFLTVEDAAAIVIAGFKRKFGL